MFILLITVQTLFTMYDIFSIAAKSQSENKKVGFSFLFLGELKSTHLLTEEVSKLVYNLSEYLQS